MTDIRKLAAAKARKYHISEHVFLRQIKQESGFNAKAVSPSGAIGPGQLMPGTAKSLGVDPHDPEQNLDGAARLMSQYVHQYGNYRDALVAYNAGPGRVGKTLYAETANYVKTILGDTNPTSTQKISEAPVTKKTTTTTSVPQFGLDNKAGVKQALIDALMSGHKNPLQAAVGAAQAGQYDSIQDPSTTTTTTESRPGSPKPASAGGAGAKGSAAGKSAVGNFEGHKVAGWMVPALQYARHHGWKGSLTSGVRTYDEQAQLYQRYLAGGNIAAKPGQSNHEIQNGGAFDATEASQLNKILQHYPGQRPIWAPTVGLNDSVHFSLNGH